LNPGNFINFNKFQHVITISGRRVQNHEQKAVPEGVEISLKAFGLKTPKGQT